MRPYRIGQIVPSSNITMETEIPAMFRFREGVEPERFTFHSSRMRMKKVTKKELEQMDSQADRCAQELADARVDVMGYACLVAIMSMGKGYHRTSEERLKAVASREGSGAHVVSSAGALIGGIKALGAKRVSIMTPYVKDLTRLVKEYIEAEGIEVIDALSLEIADNMAVGERDPLALVEIVDQLNVKGADLVVASACVQMPSLPSIAAIERKVGKPVVSAAACTVYDMLKRLQLRPFVPGAGELLSGAH
jgi:maleate isomerase